MANKVSNVHVAPKNLVFYFHYTNSDTLVISNSRLSEMFTFTPLQQFVKCNNSEGSTTCHDMFISETGTPCQLIVAFALT